MRRVVNKRTVAKMWAEQSQDSARNSNGSFFFEEKVIYSYGHHFPIACHITMDDVLGKKAVLFTSRNYSITTSGHKSLVRQAILQSYVFTVPSLGNDYYEGNPDHVANLEYYRKEIELLWAKARRARVNRQWLVNCATVMETEMNDYQAFFGLTGVVLGDGAFTVPDPLPIPQQRESLDLVATASVVPVVANFNSVPAGWDSNED